jgi:HK97 family phage major capsid protein
VPNLATLREDFARESHELEQIFQEAGPDRDLDRVKRLEGTPEQKSAEIKRRHDVINAISADLEALTHLGDIERINNLRVRQATDPLNRPSYGGPNGSVVPDGGGSVLEQKGLRGFLEQHKGYQAYRADRAGAVEIAIPVARFKTLITLGTISPQNYRTAAVPMPVETRSVLDDIGQSTTSVAINEYYEETTLTNNATMVSEGVPKPESALGWTLRTEPIGKAATWIPMTREASQDNPQLEGTIRNRLTYMVERIEERQVINGNGTTPNIRGLLQRVIQTEAKGAGTAHDAIFRAMQKIRGSGGTGFAEPTFFWVHPQNWTPIKLATETGGRYLYGGPADEPQDRIWGLPVRQTTEMPVGTALVGARPYAEVIRREEVVVMISTEHSTYFVENKIAVLAESRFGLACYRPSAFCAVTGLT